MTQTETNTVKLSPFDQLLRLYVHKLFCFPFPDCQKQPEAEARIREALSATICRWPFIVGNVCPAEESTQQNAVQLRYRTPTPDTVPDEILKIRTHTLEDFGHTYGGLAKAGMPPSALKMDALSTVPEWPEPLGTYPALTVQANFIPGGLIICFAFHHAVADGGSFIQFIKAFAEATNTPLDPTTAVLSEVPKRISFVIAPGDDVRALFSFPEYDPSDVLDEPLLPPQQLTNRIITFKASTIQKLTDSVNEILKNAKTSPKWASPVACLSSLVWVAVVRARRGRLSVDDKAKIGIAVDARPALKMKDYFGNAVVHTNAIAPVLELLPRESSSGATKCPLTIEILARAAQHMRRATEGVQEKYVNDRLKTFSALTDPSAIPGIYGRAMDTSTTGIDFSSWIAQGADVEFGIPGIGSSTIGFWRKAWSPNEGAYNILPRKGGSKGDANWEVSIGLSVTDMEKVCQQLMDGGWLERVVE